MSSLYLHTEQVLFYRAPMLRNYGSPEQTNLERLHLWSHESGSKHRTNDKKEKKEDKEEQIRGICVCRCWVTRLTIVIVKNGAYLIFCTEKGRGMRM